MSEVTKVQLDSLNDLWGRGGACMTSEWINGSGRRITKRAVPPHAKRITREEWAWNASNEWKDRNPIELKVCEIFHGHPRCKAVVAIVDYEIVAELLGHGEEVFERWKYWFGEKKPERTEQMTDEALRLLYDAWKERKAA